MRIGFSAITIGSNVDLQLLSEFNPECFELCNCSPDDWPRVRELLANSSLPIGVHCPIPFLGWLPYFEITGPDEHRRAEAMRLVEQTLRAAEEIRAEYVVTHFPTVVRQIKSSENGNNGNSRCHDMALESAYALSEMSRRIGIPLLLENVGPNPDFYSGEHFKELFTEIPSLKMCLDFGHAHVLSIGEDVYSFTEAVAPYVRSIHLYNAHPQSYRVGYHEPPLPSQKVSEGWMDLPRLLELVSRYTELSYVVFEYSRSETIADSDIKGGVAWLRSYLEGLRCTE